MTLFPLPSDGIAKANVLFEASPSTPAYEVLIDIVNITEPFDVSTFEALPREKQRESFLDQTLNALSRGVSHFGWDQTRIDACRQELVEKGFRRETIWKKPKLSPDRKLRAHVLIETEVMTHAWLVFTDRQGTEIRRVLFSIVASAMGPIEFILGELKWEDSETVRMVQENRRDYWLISTHGDVRFVYPRAATGDAQALYQLGLLYTEGQFVLQDTILGAALIQTAAEKGYKHATRYLERQSNAEARPS